MPKVYVGCVVQRKPPAHYYESLSYLEFMFPATQPKRSVLESWRKDLPRDMRIGVAVGPRHLAYDTSDPTYDTKTQWIADAVKALEVNDLVLSTGSEISPSPRDRSRLSALIADLRKRGAKCSIVWCSGGVWETETARKLAAELKIVHGQDPILDTYDVAKAYARLSAIGARAKLSDGVLEAVATAVLQQEEDGEAVIAIEAEDAFRKAKRLVAILTSVAAGDELDFAEEDEEEADDDDAGDEDEEESNEG